MTEVLRYRAACKCGWHGLWHVNPNDAAAAEDRHLSRFHFRVTDPREAPHLTRIEEVVKAPRPERNNLTSPDPRDKGDRPAPARRTNNTRRQHMRMRLTVTLDVDTDAWTKEYGIEGRGAIRADVIQYLSNTVSQSSMGDALTDLNIRNANNVKGVD